MLYAEALGLGIKTNMEAELTTIWKELKYYLSQGYNFILMSSGSLVAMKMIWEELKIPLETTKGIEEIKETASKISF